MLRPSELVVQALGLKPDPNLPTWTAEPTCCSHCAISISTGEPYSPVSLGAFFSDSRDLANSSGIVCWRCVHLRTKVLLNNLAYTVVSKDGIYPIAQNIHKAWLFLDPPEPPFVAMHSSSTMQHLAWRTPVTFDKNRIQIRFGPKLFVVKPANIRKALDIALAVTERAGGKWTNPMLLDRKAAEDFHGKLNPKAIPLMSEEEISFFRSLSAGDRWALSAVVNSKLPQPEKPEPITQVILDKVRAS
ncbi:type IV CRISPR-associated protein Csf1 [Pseudomonas luteola]